ncbi:GNAT family N-acetyltransferase [Kordiimonas aquimaris]|uniref:GNAT family N-acetyltransferase n=1 Tax=Kordiimonas aquimaris TaxID=707591 RepID=UPI0021D2535D|nr:GNAT family N-acetyltransferase [Kordiimonas aquimaris]
MATIKRYHWAINKSEYLTGLANDNFKDTWSDDLSIAPQKPGKSTYEEFYPMLKRIPWMWERKEINQESRLRTRLSRPGTQLVHLKANDAVIGFALLADPRIPLTKKFGYAADNKRVKEIEDLALFPDEAGKGRGTAYFEMFFKMLFEEYDVVYWSQSETNHPGLYAYYERMGMNHIGTTEEPDFRV